MIVFFDIGKKGAVSYFNQFKLIKISPFCITKKKQVPIKEKLINFEKLLKQQFDNQEEVTDIGCYQPFGTNRKTIINLAMMITVLILFFEKATFHFVHEWVAWKSLTKCKTIPNRIKKKRITIDWAKNKFQLQNINDDEADAIMGGYFLATKIQFTNQ